MNAQKTIVFTVIKLLLLICFLQNLPAYAKDEKQQRNLLISISVVATMILYNFYHSAQDSIYTHTYSSNTDFESFKQTTWVVNNFPGSDSTVTKTVYLDDSYTLHMLGNNLSDWVIENQVKQYHFPKRLTKNTIFKLKNNTKLHVFFTENTVSKVVIEHHNQSMEIHISPESKFFFNGPLLDAINPKQKNSAAIFLHMIDDSDQNWGCEISDQECAEESVRILE